LKDRKFQDFQNHSGGTINFVNEAMGNIPSAFFQNNLFFSRCRATGNITPPWPPAPLRVWVAVK